MIYFCINVAKNKSPLLVTWKVAEAGIFGLDA